MANLKAGTYSDFENSMAAEIEKAMQSEWKKVKGSDLPGGTGEQDRKILFVAVARGVMKFLHDHRTEIHTSQDANHHHYVDWEYQ